MFLVVLILLSVAAYFLLHAYRDWQEEQHAGLGYQRAGLKGDSNEVKGGSTGSAKAKTGTPAGGYKSSQTGKQTTQFRDSSGGGQNNKNRQAAQSASGSSQSSGNNQKSSGSTSTSSGGSKAQAASNTSANDSSNKRAGNQSTSAQVGDSSSGSVSSSGNASATTSQSGKPVTKETLRFTNREGQADDLKKISGIGPAIEKDMNAMGVYNYKQIANFQQSDVDNVNTALDFPGRIERDDWIPQAKRLMQGQGSQGQASQGQASQGQRSGSQTSSTGSQTSGATGNSGSTTGSGSTAGSGNTTKPSVTKETLRFTNREAQADDLKKINGIGPAIEKDMNAMGVYNYKQIANFQQSDIDNVNTALDFPGRIERDEWIPQAKRLMQGQGSGGQSSSTGSQTSGALAGSGNTGKPAVTKETLRFTNREAQADDLKKINGIGPAIEKDMNEMGVYNFKQIADFQQSDIDNVNTALDFPGRIERDEWIPQAKRLAQGQDSGGQSGSTGNQSSGAAASSAGSKPAVTKETLRFSNREAQADNLQLISGVGPVIEQDLNSMGIYNFSQIANFQQTDIDNVNTAMDFPGRIERDEWIPQARRLMQSNGGGSAGTASGQSGNSSRGSSSWSSGAVAGAAAAGGAAVAAAAGAANAAGSSAASPRGSSLVANASSDSPDDLAGEIRERIKILNLRQSDSRRLAVSASEFDELARGGHANLGSEKLMDVTKILRWLCDEQL